MNLEDTLRALCRENVEFVLIGGAAMALHGSSQFTRDMDFCFARSKPNAECLARALQPHHPRLRNAPAGPPVRFDGGIFQREPNVALTTDLGDIDFRAEVPGLGNYETVKQASLIMNINGLDCLVLSLSGLIRAKKAAGRPRDLFVLPELEALEELQRKMKLG
jgi:hypothetical protein